MATEKVKSAAPFVCSAPSLEPALSASTITEEKHIAAVLPLTASNANEGWESVLRVGSANLKNLGGNLLPLLSAQHICSAGPSIL